MGAHDPGLIERPLAPLVRKVRKFEYVRPPHYPKQLEAIFNPVDHKGNPARYSWIEASTKAGKTRGCIAWLAEQAILHGQPGRNYWWVAPVYQQAKIAFRRMRRALPQWMVLGSNEANLEITILNGASVSFKSGEKPDNLFGEDVWAAVVDEASRCRPAVRDAIRSTQTYTQGPVRYIGNVKGRKNWFYDGARKAQHGLDGHAYYKMTAFDAVAGGVFAASEIDDARAALPEHVFNELYMAEPADDGGNPFGLSAIMGCIAPLSDEEPFAIGVDLASSVDWTVVHALDRAGNTCGHDRFQLPWNLTTPRVSEVIDYYPALVDQTGVGRPIVESLQAVNGYVEGFTFTAQSKQGLMVGLAAAIQKGEVTYPRGVIVDELECFEYQYTRNGVCYSAPEGYHDDCVIALALAVEMRRRLLPTGVAAEPGGNIRPSAWLVEPDEDEF